MQKPVERELSNGVAERVRQVSVVNYQLLSMLEVLKEWSRKDVEDLLAAAEQTEVAARPFGSMAWLGAAGSPNSMTEMWVLAQSQVERVQRKVEHLLHMAPLQARDPALVDTLLDVLQRLRVANEKMSALMRHGGARESRADAQHQN